MAEEAGLWELAGLEGEARPLGGGGYELSATKMFVPDAGSADLLVVVMASATGSTQALTPSLRAAN